MDCDPRPTPPFASRRWVRRVAIALIVPTLLLSSCLSLMLAILFLDGAGVLPAPVRRNAWMLAVPLNWYAGLPGTGAVERLGYSAYEFGFALR